MSSSSAQSNQSSAKCAISQADPPPPLSLSVSDSIPAFALPPLSPPPEFEERTTIPTDADAEDEAKPPPPPPLSPDNKAEVSDDGEPPPPYTEGSSPIESFTYVMAAAGGPSSIITQVQVGGPPINTLGGTQIAAVFNWKFLFSLLDSEV